MWRRWIDEEEEEEEENEDEDEVGTPLRREGPDQTLAAHFIIDYITRADCTD